MSPAGALELVLPCALYTYRPAGPLICVDLVFRYTLRSAGTQVLDTLALYRHIAPLEGKAIDGRGDPAATRKTSNLQ